MEYMVTVTATDSEGETDMIYVTVMVTNVGLDNKYDKERRAAISAGKRLSGPSTTICSRVPSTGPTVIAVINLYLGIS